MTDLSNTVAPKSDQLTADDLIGRDLTIKVTKVSATGGEQPIAISFEGDSEKPYLPCKSMRRVLIMVWGKDGASYVGRSLTLYRDDKVKFGGIEVGGIRISHMSNITHPMTMALTATKANKKPYTVKPLKIEAPAKPAAEPVFEEPPSLGLDASSPRAWVRSLGKVLDACKDRDAVNGVAQHGEVVNALQKAPPSVLAEINKLVKGALDRITAEELFPDDASDFPGDRAAA